jgi:hypothetical protein
MAVETVRRRTDYFGRHEAWRASSRRLPLSPKCQIPEVTLRVQQSAHPHIPAARHSLPLQHRHAVTVGSGQSHLYF